MTPNLQAFLATIRHAEGTDRAADPYRVCYSFKHTIASLADHPAVSGEWAGEPLPDAMCVAAGLNPPCRSTAAGAYQITKATYLRLQKVLGTHGFANEVQDDMAVQLTKEVHALDMIFAGRVADALGACRGIWASLPGSNVGQPTRTFADLINVYANQGGGFA